MGKTTAARLLASRFERAAHVEADRFFDFVESGFVEPWKPESHEQNETVMRVVGDAAATYASAGYFTIVEGIVIPRWFLAPLRHVLAASRHRVSYAVLTAPLEVCIERRPEIEGGVIEEVWRQFADLEGFERNAVDVAALDPEAVVDELAAGLRGRLLLSP